MAGLLYIPRYIWKYNFHDMLLPIYVIEKNERLDRLNIIVKYFKINRGKHGLYAAKFFLCEFLNLDNVIGQKFSVDMFLPYRIAVLLRPDISF